MSKRNQRLKRERYDIRRHTSLTVQEFRKQEAEELNPPCWCGVKNPYFAPVHHETCGGTGMINCYCGGDQCVCHNHGEVECFGCAECDQSDDYDDDEYDESWG
jgi:hypothetical protein